MDGRERGREGESRRKGRKERGDHDGKEDI